MPYKTLQEKILKITNQKNSILKKQIGQICDLLHSSINYYDWVGFYFANHKEKTLHLKVYAGEETNHKTIPFGKGICGQVAISNQNFVVPDVKAESNYIACSIFVKAEIVIPLFKNGKNMGQIDIDSHTADVFTKKDVDFLVWVNEQVSMIL